MSELEPATYEAKKPRPAQFRDRKTLQWFAIIALTILIFAFYFLYRNRTRADALRTETHTIFVRDVAPAGARLQAFQQKIEAWVQEAAGKEPSGDAIEGLNLAGLHHAPGVYLRLRAASIEAGEIAEAAQTMQPDAITRCLGLNPTSLASFYSRLEYLDPAWLEQLDEAGDDVFRLEVLNTQLNNRIERELPVMLDLTQASYFLLVIERGETRLEGAVDVYLWDLQRELVLLQARTHARGRLITARSAIGGERPSHARSATSASVSAADCSIASQVRAVSGRDLIEVASEQPPPPSREAEDGATEDGATEDGATEDGATEGP